MLLSRKYLPLLLILVTWGLLLIRLNAPWWGLGDENGAWISATVRNYQLYGPVQLRFLQVLNDGPATSETYAVYIHHPPLVPWTAALGAAVFGFREASLRFITACATLIGSVAFYVFCRRIVGERQALWCLAFYVFTPMMLYYGRMPDHEALSLMFVFLFMAIFVNWLRQPTRRRWFALAALGALAAWTAWGALFFIAAALLFGLWYGKARLRRQIVGLGIITLLALVVLITYYQLAWPGTLSGLADVFFYRVGNEAGSQGSVTFTAGEYFVRQFGHIITLFTPSLSLLTLLGVGYALRQGKRLPKAVMTMLFGAPLAYLLVFRNASYIHDYYKIYFAPAFAFAASFAADGFLHAPIARRRFLSPALGGLLLAMLVTGGYFFYLLHDSSDRPYLGLMAQEIDAQTQPNDYIMTNTDYAIPAVAFYAFREIERNIEPDSALTQAKSAPVFYVYCADDKKVPEVLAGYEHTADDTCLYFWLRPDHA